MAAKSYAAKRISGYLRSLSKGASLLGALRRARSNGSVGNARRGRTGARSGGSRTRQRSRSRRGGNVKVEGTGGQISGTKRTGRVKRFTKQLYKRVSPQYIYSNDQTYYTGTAGAQAVWKFDMLCNNTTTTNNNDLNKIMNQASSYQQQITIGGTSYPVTGLAPNTQKVYLEQATTKLMLTNEEDTNCEYFIYEMIAKSDHSLDAVSCWETGLSDEQDITTAGPGLRGIVGVSPFSSERFCEFWKVIKKTRIVLGQGQSHSHYINYKPRRVFNAEALVNGDIYLKGLSYTCMVVQAGLPLHDVTNNGATTAPTATAAVWTKQIKYKVVSNNQTIFSLLTNKFTNPASMLEMDEARGVAEQPAAA